jgi:hypothetical protein
MLFAVGNRLPRRFGITASMLLCVLVSVLVAAMSMDSRRQGTRHDATPHLLLPIRHESGNAIRFPINQQQLSQLIARCCIRPPATTSALLHYWRLRSLMDHLNAASASSGLTCAELQQVFLDASTFRDIYPSAPTWYRTGPIGPIVRQKHASSNLDGEAHPGDFLCTLAECGVQLDAPIATAKGQFSVSDLLAQSLRDYRENHEGEFAAVAFACYLAPEAEFSNRMNETITFDTCMNALVEKEPGKGWCNGTHTCYAVASLLNVNARTGILSDAGRKRGESFLQTTAQLLAASQHDDGAWRADWPGGVPCAPPDGENAVWGEAIQVTGHHLEWLAIVPVEPIEHAHVDRALNFVLRQLRTASDKDIEQSYLPWSHAARSLLLWKTICTHDTQ